jgi:membrane protease YdiL (CAAX protease family)
MEKFPSALRMKLEILLVFGLLPLTLSLLKPHSWIYIILWVAALLCWLSLRKYHLYDFRADWNAAALNQASVRKILLRFIPIALALFLFAWLFIPDHLFSLPRERPLIWVMVMVLYPLLSVIPQEIIFRSFFFRRYYKLFSNAMLHVASAVAFGWVHILLQNWVAVIFSVFGGLIFAHTYSKNKSLAAGCFEHALYGCYIFTIGMGFYFYHGQSVR